jgi:hypothetical protein
MNRTYYVWIMTVICMMLASPALHAINILKYTKNLQTHTADPSSSSTLLGIMESCGNAAHLNDDCVLKGLERVSVEEDNQYARAIAANYEKALEEGNYHTLPECQLETHMQANRILGHCILLMNYYALKHQDKDYAIQKYELCLQGGMQGLVYQGNIVAQYILSNLYDIKGIHHTSEAWKKALKKRKHTEEYRLLHRCYR